ncbi:hypothetical protein [Streptacidiphilus sp. EB129]|uniref:hypothetical protein n=1 Tax=Streptacidiphilus sp. EB129 TaxID=3156262 RepID=UPI0035164985
MEDQRKTDETPKRRALDLSLVQVAASALAAVVAAILASELGVYGTFVGAAVVSVAATTGGAVFQHLFRRTGEEIRSRVPVVADADQEPAIAAPEDHEAGGRRGPKPAMRGAGDRTRAFDPFDPGGEHTRMMAAMAPPSGAESVTVYRGARPRRVRTWKTYAATSVLVFALAMTPIVITQLVTGQTISDTVRGGPTGGSVDAPPQSGNHSPTPGTGAATPGHPAGDGGTSGSAPSGSGSATPSTSPSATPSTTPSPGPSGSATPSAPVTGTPPVTAAAAPPSAGHTA